MFSFESQLDKCKSNAQLNDKGKFASNRQVNPYCWLLMAMKMQD